MDDLGFFQWLWINMADDVLVPAIKERLVVFGTLGIAIRIAAQYTKTKADDKFISAWRERFLAKKNGEQG